MLMASRLYHGEYLTGKASLPDEPAYKVDVVNPNTLVQISDYNIKYARYEKAHKNDAIIANLVMASLTLNLKV